MPTSTAQPNDDYAVLTTEEAAPAIHPKLSPRTLERWRTNGQGPAFVKVGRRVGYTVAAIRSFKTQQTRTRTVEGH
jgi:hypothetical protein